jgi:hypothetical protein
MDAETILNDGLLNKEILQRVVESLGHCLVERWVIKRFGILRDFVF